MPAPAPIYLDHAATTPLRPEARSAMLDGFAMWANPSSPHGAGRKARAALEDARDRIKAALGWDGEVIFTSGASEALELAMRQADTCTQFVSAVEHEAVLKAAPQAELLPVGPDGLLNDAVYERILADADRPLVALQTVNSETGIGQWFGRPAAAVRKRGGLLLSDAAQSAGKIALRPYDEESDMIVVSAHKLGGPVGVGALLVKDFAMLRPCGGQERGFRRGTENLPGVLGFAAALEACGEDYVADEVWNSLLGFKKLSEAAGGSWIDGSRGFIHSLAMPNLSGASQVMRFDMAGIAVSQGSACSSGSMRRSHVLAAMGVEDELADRTIRMSIGWTTSVAEIERFAEVWLAMARQSA